MSNTKNFAIEDLNSADVFDADKSLTEQGRQSRENTTIQDCEDKETNNLLEDTMAFITNCLPKRE